jgi:K+-sensing histidine kinase KdpD
MGRFRSPVVARMASRQASGHGLGLGIVRAIAGVHGATLIAHARAEGGLEIAVSFPEVR